jgi:hypothetical protein
LACYDRHCRAGAELLSGRGTGGITPGISGEPLTQLPMKETLCGESAACLCWAATPLEL